MNKVYTIACNEFTVMWGGTSDLLRKHRQLRSTVLAGLIAGLLMPSQHVLAVSYDNETLGSGGTSPSMTLNEGDTAENTTINSSGEQFVISGGSAISTTINGGYQSIFGTGASATSTIINSGGQQYVYSGGSATSTIVNSDGLQDVYGGGSTTSTTINSGSQSVESGGTAIITTINSGYQYVNSGGSVTSTTINTGGQQYIDTSGSATSTTVNSDGLQYVYSGGSSMSATINDEGTLEVEAGGSAVDITQNSGGAIYTNTSATLSGANINGSFSIADGSANNMRLENGGNLSVLNGHQATNTTINSGGLQYVSGGGSATNTTVNGGGEMVVHGIATDTIINSGGLQAVSGGGSATNTTVNGGGEMVVHGIATDTIINSGGLQAVSGGGSAMNTTVNGGGEMVVHGIATDTIINSGGLQAVSGGGSATNTTVNGGGEMVVHGIATDTIINSGGLQAVSGGGSAMNITVNGGGEMVVHGIATDTIINSGGLQSVSGGGSATNTTVNGGGHQSVYISGSVAETNINSGGMLQVEGGGSASQVTQNSGGALVTNTSSVVNGTNDKGSFSIIGGRATNMLLENGGYLTVLDSHQASDTEVGSNGTLDVHNGGVLRGTTILLDKSILTGDVVTNEGTLYFFNNSNATFANILTGTGNLIQEGGSTLFSGLLSQDGGILLKSGGAMTMNALTAKANLTTQPGTILTLDNSTILTGRIIGDRTGVGDVVIKGSSVWHLESDSTVSTLTMDNGTVDFLPSPTTSLKPDFQAVSLSLGSLSGSGTFRMNTDIASHTGDMLKVAGNASGNFLLDIQNTGREPVSAGIPLRVVQTGGGNADFTLKGGKVDYGTWEYYLNKENTDWYLQANSGQQGTENPEQVVRNTTKSADAVLNMASSPIYVFNNELQSLRFRHGDVRQNTRSPGGVWGRYIGSDNRISGGAGSGYSLTQRGIETGGDTVFELNDSQLAVGAFISYTDNSISHNRGGRSTVGSIGGGLYSTWFNNDGYYVDGVIKINRFSNDVRTWMNDGTAVKGDYHQNGFGGSLEAGRSFTMNENTWIQPYIRSTAFMAEAQDISLDNGMEAKAGTIKSLQGEVGVNLGMNFDIAGSVIRPYLITAISHEFSDNNRVRINDIYDFINDVSGTTGKYGAGISTQLTPNTGVWAEAIYQKGSNIESPVMGSIGFRINF
ncbi:autotransporter outer membrane beta-barrel domain-containing protein [Escherichia coli]|uniref:autotransporter outer membrane beta-barrel domain-containing protein n=2 Tax=Escherichia coli TaxID=562 RepID=UPI0009919E73|nr:autotransporter outer membrane beta-barrel domain-containing protein [Escherichia coli]EEZ5888913.1 autotransporter outer membrane beta-barrel domain-containing protein [Escherichia coli O146]EFC2680368.1 autotransporter outer membrane beta-barrel domain-containing protein [Escherichia coli]EFE1421498.1 autotransporter outer membrane beta-barrel domain-containing protein [Escherichia coli]EFE5029873.1 autotransporter outer membrane beta-barrel domain-containing protein [Escherichia coli]EFF